jgi:NAD-dependent dihydropyrimidine dehydrogenase PreA subunit
MFLHYYVDTRPRSADAIHEVHDEECEHMPPLQYCHYLGMFESAAHAEYMAQIIYPDAAKGCKRCMSARTKRRARAR